MDYNLTIFSGLKNNSRRTINNNKKHNLQTLTRFPSYEFDSCDIDDDEQEDVLAYDPSDYDLSLIHI